MKTMARLLTWMAGLMLDLADRLDPCTQEDSPNLFRVGSARGIPCADCLGAVEDEAHAYLVASAAGPGYYVLRKADGALLKTIHVAANVAALN